MNLSLTRKRSLFSELKNDTYFRTFALIAGVINSWRKPIGLPMG